MLYLASQQLFTASPTFFHVCEGHVYPHTYGNLPGGTRREHKWISGYKVSPARIEKALVSLCVQPILK